ncbi:MAG TPA: DUF4375 domain-containing protein [Ornithinibacter sp.]|nr:DUF4375 domain-containing protein [Ornithinibacter sp.]
MADLLQFAPAATHGVFWFVVDHVAQRWTEDPRAWHDLTPEQRTVLVLGVWRQEVLTGGFERYFRYESADTAMEALEAARLLPPAWRAVLADAVRVLGLPYPTDVDAREEILDEVLAADPCRLDAVDAAMRELERDDPCDGLLDAWVWSHRAAFFDG